MSFVRSICLIGLAAFLPFWLGCGKQDPNRGQVTGTVEVDGQPAAEGAIEFAPIDGNSAATGGEIVGGRYTVNANVGSSKVAIRVPRTIGERKLYNTPDSPVRPIQEESLPAQYNDETTLISDMKPG